MTREPRRGPDAPRRLALVLCLALAPTAGLTQETPAPKQDGAVSASVSGAVERGAAVVATLESIRDETLAESRRLDDRIAADREDELLLATRLQAAPGNPEDALRLYQDLVDALREARGSLRRSLSEWRSAPELPRFTPGLDLERLEVAGHGAEVARVRALARRSSELRREILDLERRSSWRRLEHDGRRVLDLNELRTRTIPMLDPSSRAELLGISRRGLAQLGREVEQLELTARFWWASRRHGLRSSPELLGDLVTVGVATYGLLKVLLLVLVALWARRRWRSWLEMLRRAVLRSSRTLTWKRRADVLLALAEVAAPWTLALLAVWALGWALGDAARWPEVDVLLTLAALYAGYRLSIDVAVAAIARVARRYRLRLPEERRELLTSSVRRVMRVVFAVAALLSMSVRFLGHGYLYHSVVQLAWLVVAAVLLLELVRWRRIMADAFLEVQPTGRTAALVRATRDRWTGVLVAPASFLWLAGRAAVTVAREFALGFEHTGRFLAYLFRRRVERQAERQGYAEAAVEDLPEPIVEACSEDAVERGPLVVPHFPGLDAFNRSLSEWRDGGFGGSFLLTGERGSGKTTWLAQIRREDVEIVRLALGRRVSDPGDLVRTLAGGLVQGEQPSSIEELARTLLAHPGRRVVVLDLAQHLFLAAVGGFATFAAFAELVNRTRRRVFWICGMSEYAWRHLRAVRPDAAVFRGHVHLGGWGEEDIRRLIQRRVEASGVRVSYADLVVNAMEGTSARARLIQSEEGYARLLWDYSDGNPRAALHFFLRSLEPEGDDRVRVRLFRAPDPAMLEEGGLTGLFILAAIVTHESVALADVVSVTRYPESTCRIHLDRLLDLGAVTETGDDLFRVSTHWHRAGVRLLRRRNLIPD